MAETVDCWLRQLESSLAGVRPHAAWQLGQMGDTSAMPALIRLLQTDEDEDVRWTAAWALAQLGDASAIPALETTSETDESNQVRSRAWEALRALREQGVRSTDTDPIGRHGKRVPR
jgi:HEAT repeat protein